MHQVKETASTQALKPEHSLRWAGTTKRPLSWGRTSKGRGGDAVGELQELGQITRNPVGTIRT